MTTLAEAVAAPLAIRVGFWPLRRTVQVSPLRFRDIGYYVRNRDGTRRDGYLIAWLSLRQCHPRVTYFAIWRWTRSARARRRLYETIDDLNVGVFAEKPEAADATGPEVAPEAGGVFTELAALVGWNPDVVANLTRAQAAMYLTMETETGTDGAEPTERPRWANLDEWRAEMLKTGSFSPKQMPT